MRSLLRHSIVALLIGSALVAGRQLQGQEPSAIRVTDARLQLPLDRLLEGSPTAREVLKALAKSHLPVAVGTPDDLAALPDSAGGPSFDERVAIARPTPGLGADPNLHLAWMVFRVALEGDRSMVDRAWVVVDVDGIERLIDAQGRPDAEARIEDDLVIALAHELVAHIGSVARTRKLTDFCDDPLGPRPSRESACSIRVENQVRNELNENLELEGARRFPERKSYGLEVMNFGGRDLARAPKLP